MFFVGLFYIWRLKLYVGLFTFLEFRASSSIGLFGSIFGLDKFLGYFSEEKMNIAAVFSGNLDVRITIFLSIFLDLLFWHLSLCNIRFVSHQKNESILSSRLPHEIQPFVYSLKGRSKANINHDKASISVTHVRGDECSKTLLACCIPELESQSLSLDLHGFCDEINTDGRLNLSYGTLEVNSKESWIKREIIDVFPTFWSPTSTTLNLLNLGIYYIWLILILITNS